MSNLCELPRPLYNFKRDSRLTTISTNARGEAAPRNDGERRSRRHTKSTTKVLQQWLKTHSHHPYPSDEERERLRHQTGLSVRQISDWFSNARRRSLRKAGQDPTKQSRFIHPASISVPELGASQRWEDMDPFSRWRNSPPEDEPASLSAIAQATSQATELHHMAPGQASLNDELSNCPRAARPYSDTSFESSFSGNSDSSNSIFSSDWSGSCRGPTSAENLACSFRARRRHHRRARKPLKSGHAQSQDRPYQCTFCTDRFKTKYDWTRHEGSLHLNLEQWVCTATGPTAFDSEDGLQRCCFCQEPDPTATHLETHNYQTCMNNPAAAKTFFRKDHLRQHLRLIHGIDDIQPAMSLWKNQTLTVNSRCGFCSERFQIWSERNEHIADHFREGSSMKDWKGDRGLDPAIALLVENAMPPYLIGAESREFEPFSASRGGVKGTLGLDGSRPTPTSFEKLTLELSEYVHEAVRQGITVNDESVRKQARLILFGDDDAWNQTPADNAEWLRLFRKGLNLDVTTKHISANMQNMSMVNPLDGVQPGQAFDGFHATACPPQQQLPQSCHNLQHAPPGGLPWAWQTPECLAEFSQMMQQLPNQGDTAAVSLCTGLAGGGNISLSHAWSSPGIQQAFLGQTSCPDRSRDPNSAAALDASSIGQDQSAMSTCEYLVFPFELDMFEDFPSPPEL